MGTPTLSKEAESRLVAAVKTAIDMVDNTNVSPDAAIEKVAREAGWGPEMVRLASYAYNTGRQTAQREASATALDKFATFPLADADKIISSIWPSEVKAAEDAVTDEYAVAPRWVSDRDTKERLTKAAALLGGGVVKTAAARVTPEATTHSNALDRAAVALHEAGVKKAQATEHLIAGMHKLADYFRLNPLDRLPLSHVEVAAKETHGEAVMPLLRWCVDHVGSTEKWYDEKTAASTLIEVDPEAVPMQIIAGCLKKANEVNAARAAVAAAEATLKSVKAAAYAATQKPAAALPCAESLLAEDEREEKQAAGGLLSGLVGGLGGGAAFSKLVNPNPASGVSSMAMKLDSPEHDTELRQVRTQAMLGELMATDPVIGSHNPHQVAQAYNEISQLAPRAALQPGVMRSALRSRLQGNTATFEAKELLDIDRTLADNSPSLMTAAPKDDNNA